MSKGLFITSMGLALFIICPRMAGMVNVISKYSQTSLVLTSVFGTLISIPLVVLMVLIFARFGVWGALAFAVLTDLGAAFFMKEISLKAGVETLVIAIFVVLGVRAAPYIAGLFIK
jgi:hypothetical protein